MKPVIIAIMSKPSERYAEFESINVRAEIKKACNSRYNAQTPIKSSKGTEQ